MESIYRQLQRKLNTLGLGLPETDDGYELNYLEELFTPEEADFALKMALGQQTAEEVAISMDIPFKEADAMLRSMSNRNLLFRLHDGETVTYGLVPIIHGFLEFNVSRLTYSIARNFSKHYMRGMGARFYGSTEPLFRVLPIRRDVVENDECLDIDDVEAIIRRQDKIALTPCFCRTSANMNPKAAGCRHNPEYQDLCMVFGTFADFYVENSNAYYISTDKALEHMAQCNKNGNIIEVLNTNDVEVMCSCCPCCCGVMKALMLFGGPSKEFASNYKVSYDTSLCTGCGACGRRCFMKAIEVAEDGGIAVNGDNCVGCGLCVTTCPAKALKLYRKPESAVYRPPTRTVLELYDYVRKLRRETGEI